MTENSEVLTKTKRKLNSISYWDILTVIFTLLLNVAGSFTDLIAAACYFEGYEYFWAVATTAIFLFAFLTIPTISIHWLSSDLNYTSKSTCIFNATFPSLSFRVISFLRAWYSRFDKVSESDPEPREKNVSKLFEELRVLFLFDAFLRPVPQLVFQLFVLSTTKHVAVYTGVSICVNISCILASLVLYGKGEVSANSRTGWALTIFTLWKLGMLIARTSAFVMLLIVFQLWFLLFIGVHWITMFVLVSYKLMEDKPNNKEQGRGICCDVLCCGMIAILFCYCFFNLKPSHSRWRLVSFYALIFLQNMTCLTGFLMFYEGATSFLAITVFICILGGTFIGVVNMLLYHRLFHQSTPQLSSHFSQFSITCNTNQPHGPEKGGDSAFEANNTSSDSKLEFGDSIVVVEEPYMEDIENVHKWIKDASNQPMEIEGVSPVAELEEGGSSVFSTHDYENLAAVNIFRAGGMTMWKGYSDIDTYVHDDSVGRTNASTITTTTTSQDYLDAIADDYADCKTQSSLQTILEESEQSICSNANGLPLANACTLVATIDQIRVATPVQEERFSLVRRTFSILRERFESRDNYPMETWTSDPGPPPPPVSRARNTFSILRERFDGGRDPGQPAPSIETRETPTKFKSVRDMRSFFLKQVFTPPKLAALKKKKIFSPNNVNVGATR